jgi:hypothetical protein
MTRSLILILLLLLLALTGCLGPGPAPTMTPAPTATVPPPPPPLPTRAPATATALPTATVPPTATELPAPTATAPPTTTPGPAAAGLWRRAETEHFTFYYLPGSRAEQDLAPIQAAGEQAMAEVAAALAVAPTTRIQVYFVNRIFWQGGASYPDNVLLLSYPEPDRDYVASDLPTVFRHEIAHALVGQAVGDDRKGGMLGEGVAVWAARGHYHEEMLDVAAATLLEPNADLYIPLPALRSDFYNQQHELAYLESGALVRFLIARHGVAAFKRLLAAPDKPDQIYDQSWLELEAAWRESLQALQPTVADAEAVRLRVRYYDVMRRYEEQRDPDARLLPDRAPPEWDAALVARFSRANPDPADIALERQLTTAGRALWTGAPATAARLLDEVEAAMPAAR